jgi:hypothetical protein
VSWGDLIARGLWVVVVAASVAFIASAAPYTEAQCASINARIEAFELCRQDDRCAYSREDVRDYLRDRKRRVEGCDTYTRGGTA